MKKRLFGLFLCILLFSSFGFSQIQARWVKGKFTRILSFDKQFLVKELSAAPSATTGYGTLYALSADGDLYYKDDAGNATNLGTITAGAHAMSTHTDEDTYTLATTGTGQVSGAIIAHATLSTLEFDVSTGTDNHFIEASAAEGLANTGMRIVLDENGSNNSLALVVTNEVDRNVDYGLVARAGPEIFIARGNASAEGTRFTSSGFATHPTSRDATLIAENFNIYHGADQAGASVNIVNISSTGDSFELTGTTTQQAYLKVGARVNQSSTAGFDGIWIDTLEEAFGDGTGTNADGNNLFRASSLGTTAFQVQIPNSSLTYVHTSTLFDIVGLVDSVTICTIPANSIILSISMELEAQFVATSMTDLDVTVGDGVDADGFMVKAMNLISDAVGTNYATRGALWNTDQSGGFFYTQGAETIVATATAVGANLSTTSAGQVRFTVAYMCLDEQ